MIIDKITEIIILYLPTVLSILSVFSNVTIVRKGFKSLSINRDIDKLIAENRLLREDNKAIRAQLSILIDKEMKVKNYEKLHKK